jgi:hypothetical protein
LATLSGNAGVRKPTAATAQSSKASLAQAALSKRLSSVASEIQDLLAKAKTPLEGELRFTSNAQGGVTVYASARDRATLTAALKGDKSRPSLAARLTAMTKEAQSLAATTSQQSAYVRAARYATRAGNVMSLYAALLQQEASGESASLNISNTSSSVSYAGSLQLKA